MPLFIAISCEFRFGTTRFWCCPATSSGVAQLAASTIKTGIRRDRNSLGRADAPVISQSVGLQSWRGIW